MARLLLHHVVPNIALAISILLLAALAPPATAEDTPAKKLGMRLRHVNKEEAQWLDRYAETHLPLGAGPLRMVRATPEEEHLLNNRFSDIGESHNREDGSGYIDFDDDNPYVHALRDWVFRLAKRSMEKAGQTEDPFQDF